jgi:hypothetical protein
MYRYVRVRTETFRKIYFLPTILFFGKKEIFFIFYLLKVYHHWGYDHDILNHNSIERRSKTSIYIISTIFLNHKLLQDIFILSLCARRHNKSRHSVTTMATNKQHIE